MFQWFSPPILPGEVAGELLEKRLSKLGLSIHTAVELQEVLCNEEGVRFVRLRKRAWGVRGWWWMGHQSLPMEGS